MSLPVPTISLDELLATDQATPDPQGPNPRELLQSAEVILGQERDSGQQFIVYGREAVEEMAAGESGQSRRVAIVAVELDLASNELPRLLALVEAIKGYHDHQGGVTPPPPSPPL